MTTRAQKILDIINSKEFTQKRDKAFLADALKEILKEVCVNELRMTEGWMRENNYITRELWQISDELENL